VDSIRSDNNPWIIMDKDDRWYLLWVRKHKSCYGVHRMYMSKNVATLVPNSQFYKQNWGHTNKEYSTMEEARAEMEMLVSTKLKRGYTIVERG